MTADDVKELLAELPMYVLLGIAYAMVIVAVPVVLAGRAVMWWARRRLEVTNGQIG